MQDEVFETMHAGELQSFWEVIGFDEITDNPYNPMLFLKVSDKELWLHHCGKLDIKEGKNKITLRDVNICFVMDLIATIKND